MFWRLDYAAVSVSGQTLFFCNFHAYVKSIDIRKRFILCRSSSIWILYWPHVEIMQPEFIWRVSEIHLLNSQPTPADGCISTEQRWVSIYGKADCLLNLARVLDEMQQTARQHAGLLFHGAVCDRAPRPVFNGLVCDRRAAERNRGKMRVRHQRSQASTRLFALGITSRASEKTQGGENEQPGPSPAGGVSNKPPLTQLHEQGCPWTRHGWRRRPCLSHLNVVCFGLGTWVTCYFNCN